MSNTKKITYLAMGIALYVVLGMMINIPIIGHIQTDFGYVAYGAFLSILGFPAIIVGVLGCVIESLVLSGWFPIGWAVGQLAIGLICGIAFKWIVKVKNVFLRYFAYIIIISLAVFIGIGLIKTVIECNLYGIPLQIKFLKDCVATVADIPPMIIGVAVADIINKRVRKVGNGYE